MGGDMRGLLLPSDGRDGETNSQFPPTDREVRWAFS